MLIDAAWAFRIPEGMSSAEAAPLMCAGATVFNPLFHHVKPGSAVGVVGIGGLGHLAIQFARKMGARVTVFTSGKGKGEEAVRLGAKEVVVVGEGMEVREKVEHLIVTSSGKPPDWNL